MKIQLTHNQNADIEFEIVDDNDKLLEICLTISRDEFEALIEPTIDNTIEMIEKMLDRNKIHSKQINYVLLVGGSTYIPMVKFKIKNKLGISPECSIDPTTAVVVGAAFYAGTKQKKSIETVSERIYKDDVDTNLNIRMAYQKTSHDIEEYFVAEIDGDTENKFYRIVRNDGGFDTGLKKLGKRISEMLPLIQNSFNSFSIKILNSNQISLNINLSEIGILHGKFNVVGQPLPNDICLEIDDNQNNTTKLEVIFERNSILPIKKTLTRCMSKNILKGSRDSLIINVVEGNRFSSPASNLTIGTIEIKGEEITRDLIKGSDVDISFEISESRDLKITTYLMLTDQEFCNIFSPTQRMVNIGHLKSEVDLMLSKSNDSLNVLTKLEKYEQAGTIHRIIKELRDLQLKLSEITEDDTTDLRYQLDDKKRDLAKKMDINIEDSLILNIKMEYFDVKKTTKFYVYEKGNDNQQEQFKQIIACEKEVFDTNNQQNIKELIEKLQNLSWQIKQKDPDYLTFLFLYYSDVNGLPYKDKLRAQHYADKGEKALEKKNYDELLIIIYQLYNLLPEQNKQEMKIRGTGIE